MTCSKCKSPSVMWIGSEPDTMFRMCMFCGTKDSYDDKQTPPSKTRACNKSVLRKIDAGLPIRRINVLRKR